MRRSHRLISLAVGLGLLILPSVAEATPTLLGGTYLHFEIRPRHILVTGDGTGWIGGPGWRQRDHHIPSNFGRIGWRTWNERQAKGRAVMWINNCLPDCAEGSFYHYPAHVRAWEVLENHYQRMSVTFPFKGHVRTERYRLFSAGSANYWRYG